MGAATTRAAGGAPMRAATMRAAVIAALFALPCASLRRAAAPARRLAPRLQSAATAAPACTTVNVELGDRAYPIYIGDGLLTSDAATAASYLQPHVGGSQVLVVASEVVAGHGYLGDRRGAEARRQGREAPRGDARPPDNDDEPSEATKTLENLGVITDYSDRKAQCTFVALGGGVIGDMVGFAAACYVRGVNFIQIPTTLMAMVDSSVGGKTAVNSRGAKNRVLQFRFNMSAKNMVGAFYQPVAVVADVGSLNTLPERELASGVSEIIKYGLIRDAPFFEWLEREGVEAMLARDRKALIQGVEDSCRNKAEVVALDEKEGGLRATLNLGHTFGHAVETKSGYGTWLHGEAVGIGMSMAAHMSHELGWIDADLKERCIALVKKARVPAFLPLYSPMDVASFEAIMAVDKKVADGALRLILLKGALGNCVFTADYDKDVLKKTPVPRRRARTRTIGVPDLGGDRRDDRGPRRRRR
ncbi:shikimate 3-dehydrogenase [Aureococcus anophagefferens]|nr:shikimate 3-dehydrogenase [Aureococcus anophagefferens]